MKLELGIRAYEELFEKTPRKKVSIKYSGRFRDYGANITSSPSEIRFGLSKEFLETSQEIQIGVMQYLLCKLYKSKERTMSMDLYDSFLKNIGEWTHKGEIEDEELRQSFERVNQNYFDNYMTAPKIRWGRESKTRLGYYSYSTDSITLSTILKGAGNILDYVMYHELLHKKHKFSMKGNRAHSHTPAFKRDERKFRMSDSTNPEKALTEYLRSKAKPGLLKKLLDF